MICTDASPVQPMLKTWLLRDLHCLWNTVCPMHRCPFLNHRFIRCLQADLASIPFCTKIPWHRFFRQPSDAPVLHASVLPVLLTEELSSLELDSSSLSSSSSSSCSLELDESCRLGWCLHECLAVRLFLLKEEVDSCSFFFVIPILYSWAMI